MAVGYVYVLLNQSYEGLVKIGKSTRHPDRRAQELSGTGVLHPYLVAYYQEVSDCDLAERLIHEELKESRRSANREFFKVSSTEAIGVLQRIVEQVNSQIPFPLPQLAKVPENEPPPPPPRLYAVSFSCVSCGNYGSNTVEPSATTVRCPSCQHENALGVTLVRNQTQDA